MNQKLRRIGWLLSGCFLAQLCIPAQAQQPAYQGVIGKTLEQSKEWWPQPQKAPAGAPNIIWILLDDVGYGASSAFGGVISTPTFDSLANQGLRYTNFHTAGICAPSRAALLTGRNHHYVHMGGFAHLSTSAGFPGYDGRIPTDKGTVAEILRENGVSRRTRIPASLDLLIAGPAVKVSIISSASWVPQRTNINPTS